MSSRFAPGLGPQAALSCWLNSQAAEMPRISGPRVPQRDLGSPTTRSKTERLRRWLSYASLAQSNGLQLQIINHLQGLAGLCGVPCAECPTNTHSRNTIIPSSPRLCSMMEIRTQDFRRMGSVLGSSMMFLACLAAYRLIETVLPVMLQRFPRAHSRGDLHRCRFRSLLP